MQAFPASEGSLFVTLSSEGLITAVSAGCEQWTGYAPRELAGVPITRILADSSAYETPRLLTSARESGAWEGSLLFKTREGLRRESRAAIARLSENGYLLAAGPMREQAETAGGSALSEAAGAMRRFAHDLNNPLAVMMGFAQLLLADPECQGRMRTDLEKLYAELQRVAETVEKLHGYAVSLTPVSMPTAAVPEPSY